MAAGPLADALQPSYGMLIFSVSIHQSLLDATYLGVTDNSLSYSLWNDAGEV